MGILRKEILTGLLFAVVMAIFINYSSIERLFIDKREIDETMLYPLIFSTVWFIAISLILYIYYVSSFNLLSKYGNGAVQLVPTFIGALILAYMFSVMQPVIRELFAPEGFDASRMMRGDGGLVLSGAGGGGGGASGAGGMRPPRGMMSATLFKHLLVLVLNLLFFYIQRLLYTNQAIARRNEQLQFETVKSQHNALLQQINPHFFFNSLNSLRYIIMKGDSEPAVEYLDNLITIFRKTLKASSNTLHTLSEEISITTSYTHIVERRFEGKFSVEFALDEMYEGYMIAPLTLLTLVENVVKHNKIASQMPVKVRIFTTEKGEIVVENNIVPKFEEIEESGIGLKNLNLQYELLINRGIVVDSDETLFRVTLPLIEHKI